MQAAGGLLVGLKSSMSKDGNIRNQVNTFSFFRKEPRADLTPLLGMLYNCWNIDALLVMKLRFRRKSSRTVGLSHHCRMLLIKIFKPAYISNNKNYLGYIKKEVLDVHDNRTSDTG